MSKKWNEIRTEFSTRKNFRSSSSSIWARRAFSKWKKISTDGKRNFSKSFVANSIENNRIVEIFFFSLKKISSWSKTSGKAVRFASNALKPRFSPLKSKSFSSLSSNCAPETWCRFLVCERELLESKSKRKIQFYSFHAFVDENSSIFSWFR